VNSHRRENGKQPHPRMADRGKSEFSLFNSAARRLGGPVERRQRLSTATTEWTTLSTRWWYHCGCLVRALFAANSLGSKHPHPVLQGCGLSSLLSAV